MSKIKVRLKSGKLYNVKEAAFIEICNDEGKLAALVYPSDDGSVNVCEYGDPPFMRYLTSYKKEGIRTIPVKVPELKVTGKPNMHPERGD